MKILMICNKAPFPPREGGPIAMNMIVEGLISEGHQVKVLAVNSFKYTINPDDIPADYKAKTGIELIDVDLRIKPVAAFLNLFTGRSYHVERFISSDFRKRLVEVLQTNHFDIVQMETIFVAPYLETVRACSDAKVVLRAHNIEYLIWSRVADTTPNPLKRRYLRHLANTLKRYELSMLSQFDGIAAITQKDADYFRNTKYEIRNPNRSEAELGGAKPKTRNPKPETRIISIPFGIDLENFPP